MSRDKAHYLPNRPSWRTLCGWDVQKNGGSGVGSPERASCPICLDAYFGPNRSHQRGEEDLADWDCTRCGEKRVNLCWSEAVTTRLEKYRLCFSCDFWHELKQRYGGDPRKGAVIINGAHHTAEDRLKPPSPFHGCGGAIFRFQALTQFGGRQIECNDVWHQGTIPPEWRSDLPDNAIRLKARPWRWDKERRIWKLPKEHRE